MKISIVIVTYNSSSSIEETLKSIVLSKTNIDYEVIVVDNNSSDNTKNIVKNYEKEYKNIRLLALESNIGFSKANNRGAQVSCGEFILILNPDVIIVDYTLDQILTEFHKHNDIGIYACKLLNVDRSLQYTCRRFLGFFEFLFSRTPIKRFMASRYINKSKSKYLMEDYDHENPIEVDWVIGAFMLIDSRIYSQIGGFDERYFLYFEDMDLCYKMKIRGLRVIYDPKISLIHIYSQDSTKKFGKTSILHFKSMFKFYSLHKELFRNQK
jgi:GT2 family glycosyltransferase